jgi:hypothetical protein
MATNLPHRQIEIHSTVTTAPQGSRAHVSKHAPSQFKFYPICRFRFALRRDPSVASVVANNTNFPFPVQQHSLFGSFPRPACAQPKVMRFPPHPFSFSGITKNRFFIPSRLATSGTPSSSESSHHPYLVPRNSRGTLPVYSDVRNGGTRYLISIRNVEGNIKVCDPTTPHDRSPLIRITKGSS